MKSQGPIFIVDDDADVRDSLRALLESADFEVEDFDSAAGFLAAVSPGRGACLVVDIRMPDMDGLTLQEELVRRQANLPVIIVTGHGDVPLAVSGGVIIIPERMGLSRNDLLPLRSGP